MQLPSHIEKELRDYSKEMGWSEVEYLHYVEALIKLAKLAKEESERKQELKLTKAA